MGLKSLVPTEENIPEYPIRQVKTVHSSTLTEARLQTSPKVTLTPVDYNPYPDYSADEYQSIWHGQYHQCRVQNSSLSKPVQAYQGVPSGFPDALVGSHKAIGLDDSVCFERKARLSPYGYKDMTEISHITYDEIDLRSLNWKSLQDDCFTKNADRFLSSRSSASSEPIQDSQMKKTLFRTAVLIRVWDEYVWQPLDYIHLRSLITELSLNTGGEYKVHILVHVRNSTLPIWSEESAYEDVVKKHISKEFQGLVTLWDERSMKNWYPGLNGTHLGRDIHGAYRGIFMPVQWFAQMHPEYDYFWNWEQDVRYTGHFYHLLSQITEFARKQPRKGLWERNGRFYIPEAHGSWSNFSSLVDIQEKNTKSVWGPVVVEGVDTSKDQRPPFPKPEDDIGSTWGVGEEADLITLNPIFDPWNTTWILRDDYSGYGRERPDGAVLNKKWDGPPRRASIITLSRLSRKLLMTMHHENALHKHFLFAEMWPMTCALHHGMKAVFAPHPIYMDRRWPIKHLETVYNNGLNGASGGRKESIFGDREFNTQGSTWYFNAKFSNGLWRRWLGMKWQKQGGAEWEAEHGRMCLPGMLLHPVKELKG